MRFDIDLDQFVTETLTTPSGRTVKLLNDDFQQQHCSDSQVLLGVQCTDMSTELKVWAEFQKQFKVVRYVHPNDVIFRQTACRMADEESADYIYLEKFGQFV